MTETEKQREILIQEKVEMIGVFLEQEARNSSITPLAGRMFGYLLLSDPPHRNFYEIQSFLQASKSSVSMALKVLTAEGVVDYFTLTGDRKRYFRVNADNWLELMKRHIVKSTLAAEFAREVLVFRQDSEFSDFNHGIEKVLAFQEFIAKGLNQLMLDWDNQHSE